VIGRRQSPRGLWLGSKHLLYWDSGFEFSRLHGYLPLLSIVCCLVEVSVSWWSLVKRSPTECGVSHW